MLSNILGLRIKTRQVVGTKTVRQSGITIVGTFISGTVGALTYICLARILGPLDYGVFSVSVATAAMLFSISNVGTDTGITRFVGKYINKDRDKALEFLKLGIKVKLVAWILVMIVGWVIMPVVSEVLLKKPNLLIPLRISLLGVGSSLLFSFSTASIQAIQRFFIWSALMVSMNALRFIIIGILFFLGFLGLYSGIWTFVLVPFLGFFMGLAFLPNFWQKKETGEVRREFFHYNKWVALFTLVTAISSRLDTFLTARYLSLADVGVYSVAVALSGFVAQVTLALATVVAPKFSAFENRSDALSYIKKLQLLVLTLAFVGVLSGLLLGYFLIPKLFGSEYALAFGPFVFLLLAQAIFFIAVPINGAVMYYFSYPKLFMGVSAGFLAIVAVLGSMLISKLGILGAGITMFVAQSFNYAIPLIWVINKFRNENSST